MDEEYKSGDVVRVTTDRSIGIVTSQKQNYLNVLFHNYRCMPIKRTLVEHTGKHIELEEIWERI